MTKPKRYQRYSAEFKREAILRASEEGMTVKAVCEELGISARQFQRWPAPQLFRHEPTDERLPHWFAAMTRSGSSFAPV